MAAVCSVVRVDDAASWRAQRREAYQAHAAALDRQRAADTAKARELVQDFVNEMQRRGQRPGLLRARVPGTTTTYRTSIQGWYIRQNRSLGVSVAGDYYILDTARSMRSFIAGVDLEPSDPPIVVGVGARDGESMPLDQLLQRRLTPPSTS